ncbi:TPA: hypothetical protein N0F65_000227 [Lagenidium giganteum]|uniref:Rab-GAP TBC domain-containing protein n=1 Tax=Lagenidium giganteum TaxID=4803 RepID=A0AAV2YGE5_9STRA|nr:TPA: hypothetical protein N0F65_000227 [Lagenidium giganteum]
MAEALTPQMNTTDNQQEEQRNRAQRSSYRLLGTYSSQGAVDEEEEEDPMAWADLEEFGGTKKTLEKKKPVRKLTPEEVRQQLLELKELDSKMSEATIEKRSKKGMNDTIAWLKKHSSEVETAENQKRKRSSSFVRSVLDFFGGSRSRHNSRNEMDAGNQVLEENDNFPKLASPWAKSVLTGHWSKLGFSLLNQSILEDIVRVRTVIMAEELATATPQAIASLAKWLQLFDQHVDHVTKLKEYLLEECTVIAGVGYKVTTLYDLYKEALAIALGKTHDDRKELGEAILHMFAELEAILKDELLAVQEVIQQTLNEAKAYEALSCLFHNLTDDEECGVIVSKLLGWMKNNLSDSEVKAFLALFDHDVHEKIAGEWMRHYATYLQQLDHFPVDYDRSLAFFTTLFVPLHPEKIAGEWMRHYATYLQQLDHFPVDYDRSLAFFTTLFVPLHPEKIAGEWMRHYATYLQQLDHFPVDYDRSLAFFTTAFVARWLAVMAVWAPTAAIDDYVVPSFDFAQLSEQAPQMLAALQIDGIVAIKNVPGYHEQRAAFLEQAVACTVKSQAAGADFLLHRTLKDGTQRYTISTESGHALETAASDTTDACPGYQEVYQSFSALLEAAVAVFGHALDDSGLAIDSSDLNAHDLLTDAVHLDHFHAYQAVATTARRLQTTSTDNNNNLSLDMHTDNGLMIAMTAPEYFDLLDSGSLQPKKSSSADAGLRIVTGAGTTVRPLMQKDELVLMMGSGIDRWIKTTPPLHPVLHGMRFPREVDYADGEMRKVLRGWFGKMILLAKDHRMENTGMSFGDYSHKTTRYLMESQMDREFTEVACPKFRRLEESAACYVRNCTASSGAESLENSCQITCNHDGDDEKCDKYCKCDNSTMQGHICWMLCVADIPASQCSAQQCNNGDSLDNLAMKCTAPIASNKTGNATGNTTNASTSAPTTTSTPKPSSFALQLGPAIAFTVAVAIALA